MSDVDGRALETGQASAGARQHVGWFRFYVADQRWEWSEQVERMHGYQPGSVTPTTELMLRHRHPDDRRDVTKTINQMLRPRGPFGSRHRIVDTRGEVHEVVVVGDQLTDSEDGVVGTHGYYVDITPTTDRAAEDIITARIAEITQNRAVIEQAKGMLMLVYGLEPGAAFDLLRWRSQAGNVKLRTLAERVVDAFRNVRDVAISSRAVFDHALLTVEGSDAEVTPVAD